MTDRLPHDPKKEPDEDRPIKRTDITLGREDLIKKFQNGSLPSEDDFAKLINSTVNQLDDGFDKTINDGLKIASLGNSTSLLSFYNKTAGGQQWDQNSPIWRVGHGENSNELRFRGHDPDVIGSDDDAVGSALTMAFETGNARVGINKETPDETLDVNGTARMHGRRGRFATAPANGKWHPIVKDLKGCSAFEVIAGVRAAKGEGRYALMHAIAMNAHNPRGFISWLHRQRRIRTQHAYYASRCDRLRLRWATTDDAYELQIRTGCPFAGYLIHYEVTTLWFDPMTDDGERYREPEASDETPAGAGDK